MEKKRFAPRNTESKNDLANRCYLLTDSFTVNGQGDYVSKVRGNLDCSSDEKINNLDLSILLSSWTANESVNPLFAGLNNDAFVNEKDLVIFSEELERLVGQSPLRVLEKMLLKVSLFLFYGA